MKKPDRFAWIVASFLFIIVEGILMILKDQGTLADTAFLTILSWLLVLAGVACIVRFAILDFRKRR